MKTSYLRRSPTISLFDMIRRRNLTFKDWLSHAGVSSYPELLRWTEMIGVIPPTEEEYKKVCPDVINAPADGIVVVGDIEPAPEVPVSTPKLQKKKKKEAPVELTTEALKVTN